MKKLYIFDFDGTLVNTFYDSVISYNQALKQHNLPEYEYDSLESIDYEDFSQLMSHDMNILETYMDIYEKSPKENTKAYPGVKKVLKELINEGKEVAICSNRIQYQLDDYTNKIFPDITFKFVVGYTMDGPYKPQPEAINQILDNVDYTLDEIIYVGDKTVDIVTAENVNLDVVIVKWGQGNEEAYLHEYPLKVIDNIEKLLNI